MEESLGQDDGLLQGREEILMAERAGRFPVHVGTKGGRIWGLGRA